MTRIVPVRVVSKTKQNKTRKISEDVTQKKRKEGNGEETTLIGVYAHVEVHTIQFSLHMRSGSSQRSLGDSIKFFFF